MNYFFIRVFVAIKNVVIEFIKLKRIINTLRPLKISHEYTNELFFHLCIRGYQKCGYRINKIKEDY